MLDKETQTLIQSSIEKAQEKLLAARDLLKQKHYDDAVSRAYYAVFHAASAVLLTEGARAETHRGLVTLFGLLLVKTGKIEKEYGKYLSNLKDDRETGDYEIFSTLDEEAAKNSIREAQAFVSRIQSYLEML